MDLDELRNRFTYHAPQDSATAAAYITIRGKAMLLANTLNKTCPDSRELSLAITHLEEMVFWANAAIARHGLTAEDETVPTDEPVFVRGNDIIDRLAADLPISDTGSSATSTGTGWCAPSP